MELHVHHNTLKAYRMHGAVIPRSGSPVKRSAVGCHGVCLTAIELSAEIWHRVVDAVAVDAHRPTGKYLPLWVRKCGSVGRFFFTSWPHKVIRMLWESSIQDLALGSLFASYNGPGHEIHKTAYMNNIECPLLVHPPISDVVAHSLCQFESIPRGGCQVV